MSPSGLANAEYFSNVLAPLSRGLKPGPLTVCDISLITDVGRIFYQCMGSVPTQHLMICSGNLGLGS